jgi:hypothetical protein
LPIIKNIASKLLNLSSNNFPIVIDENRYEKYNFKISIKNTQELDHARSLLKNLEVGGFARDELCRVLHIKFTHPSIYGQTVHATQSSEIIKLCERGSTFPGGVVVKADRAYLAHYREIFNFGLILNNNELSVSQFHFDHNIFKYCS